MCIGVICGFSALNIGTEHAEGTVRHGFVGIIVPSLWGGLGRGLLNRVSLLLSELLTFTF